MPKNPSQPDGSRVIQELLREVEEKSEHIWSVGRVGELNDEKAYYVTHETIKKWVTEDRVYKLLEALFRDAHQPPPPSKYIHGHYLRPFIILIIIGEGPMIHHFITHDELKDSCLPHRAKPQCFPRSTQRDLWQEYDKAQWGFCPQEFTYNMVSHLHPRIILPIGHIQILSNDGASAVTYRITIEEEYNQLLPDDDADSDLLHDYRNEFVLKTYRKEGAKSYYDNECDAFRRLSRGRKPPNNIIAFYGGFSRGETYNIILEYADGGTLEDYMKHTREPKNFLERSSFWKNYLDLLNGLQTIHLPPGNTSGGPQIFLGWHQDLNPSNILVKTRRAAANPYDCHFKIADLGISHFKRYVMGTDSATDNDTFGSRTYGAPETVRFNENVENSHIQVRQDVDIWSMGCVTSEVATWASQGWEKVVTYRNSRRAEKKALGQVGEDCFHHDSELLQSVHDMHIDVIENRRNGDEYMERIVKQIVEAMLMTKTGDRPAAQFLYARSHMLCQQAKKIEMSQKPASRLSSGPDPYRPDVSAASSPADTHSPQHDGVTRPQAVSGHKYPIYTGPNNWAGLGLSTRQLPYHAGPHEPQGHGMDIVQSPIPNRALGHNASTYRYLPSTYAGTQDSRQTEPSPFSQPSTQSEEHQPRYSLPGSPNPVPWASSNSTQGTHNANGPSPASGHSSSLALMSPADPKSQKTRDPPYLSLEDGLDWRRRCKNFNPMFGGEEPKLENAEDHFPLLYGRDLFLLIDNSKSMKEHHKDIYRLVSLLSFIFKKLDKDGIDVDYTNSTDGRHSKKSTVIRNDLEHLKYQGVADMSTRLSSILGKYNVGQVCKTNSGRRLKRLLSANQPQQRRWSFYILTNGKWNSNDVGPVIMNLVRNMEKNGLNKDDVGIQFIRFGTDKDGIARMDHLDDGLGLKERNMDIVDTTYWNGNIWKQLLGAISTYYDDVEG